MEAPQSAGGRESAVLERRRRLQEYLAAKGKLRPASTKPYLKDNSRQKNVAPSKAQPTVGSQKNVAPGTAKTTSTQETKGSGPARKTHPDGPSGAPVHQEANIAPARFPRKGPPTLPPPSKPPARKHPEKLTSSSTSLGRHLGRTREPGKGKSAATSRTSGGISDSSKAERNKENSGPKLAGQPQKRETSRFSRQAKPQVKISKQAVENSTLSKNQAGPSRAAVAQVKPRGGPQRQICSISAVRPSLPLRRPSAVSRPGVEDRNPRLIKQPGAIPQATSLLVSGGSLAGREDTDSSVLQRGLSRPQAGVLQESKLPSHCGALQRKRKATLEGCHSSAPGGTKQNGSLARRDPDSKKFKQAPRTLEPKSRHTASEWGSGGRGRGTPRAKQPAREASQEPKTPGTQDRRKMLEEWLASQGKRYKRPPMTFPVKRQPPPKEKKTLDRSFADCMEEEAEQLEVAHQIASTLAECLKLAEEGVPSEELLAMLSRIPEAEKFAQFWACKAKLLARQGPFDAAGLYHAAACAGAVPLRELRDALVDTLKTSSQAWAATPAELRLPSKPQLQSSPQSAWQGPACKPLLAIKLQVASLPRAKEPSAKPGLKLLTPVRRSLRIERASARYPQMLRDHDPVVSSLVEIMDTDEGNHFLFRENEALLEKVEMEAFVPGRHPAPAPRTSAPPSPGPSLRMPLFC